MLTTLIAATLGLLALFGHAVIWVGIVNRWHATGNPRWLVKSVTQPMYAVLLGIPVAYAVWSLRNHSLLAGGFLPGGATDVRWLYVWLSVAVAVVYLPVWVIRRLERSDRGLLISEQVEVLDLGSRFAAKPIAGLKARLLAGVPGNQLLDNQISTKVLHVPGLPDVLDGLVILHLADLHYSGRVTRPWFDELFSRIEQVQADLLAVTGDICDADPYIDWIDGTLGRLEFPHGKYFIFGNHDLRVKDRARLRRAMTDAGYVDLGGHHATLEIRGQQVLLMGNEAPWLPRPTELSNPSAGTFKVLLAHTPDELGWAQRQGFQLMLAGHTHGGQIRFPLIGPVICPSWHGIRYAAGVFHRPPTVLHVTRGTASYAPLRLNCPQEVVRLVLRSQPAQA